MQRIVEWMIGWPKLGVAVVLFITAGLGAGLPNVRTEFGYRVLLGEEHPAIQKLDRFIEEFGGGLPIRVAWECGTGQPCGDVFDRPSLEMARSVSRRLEAAPRIRRVESPATSPLLVATSDGLAVRRFFEDDRIADDRLRLAEHALSDPLWLGALVSEDASLGSIVVQQSDTQSETDLVVIQSIEDAIREFRDKGFQFHLVGTPVSAVLGGRQLAKSMSGLLPLTVLLVAVVVSVALRSWMLACGVVLSTGIGIVWTFGLLGWLGWPRDAIGEILASLLLVVGVSTGVHFASRYSEGLRRIPRPDALSEAARDVGAACLVTALTSSAALVSFATSDLATFFRFGVMSAAGVLLCFFASFLVLPLWALMSPRERREARTVGPVWGRFLTHVALISARRSRSVLTVAAAVAVLGGFGWATRLEVDTYWNEMIGEHTELVRSIRVIESRLAPSSTLEIELAIPSGARATDHEVLARVAAISAAIPAIQGLGKARSIVDIIEQVQERLYGGRARFESKAAIDQANAETVDFVSMADADLIDAWVNFDRTRLRVSAEARELPNRERTRVLQAVGALLDDRLPEGWSWEMTGDLAMNHDWVRDIQATQLRSFPTAFLLVFVLVAIFLRSFWLGIAAMLPTALPVVVTLGAMGWMGMSLDVGRAMIAAVVLGIAVDDSIHLLVQYRRERIQGTGPGKAIQRSVLHVGRAVVTTSLALALGFLTLMASAWQSVSSFGFYVALAILGALAADLLVLPALIYVFAGSKGDDMPAQPRVRLPLRAVARRRLLLVFVVMPVVGTLGLAVAGAVRPGVHQELPCWVLPNARIAMLATLQADCPLPPHTPIRAVRVADGRVVPIASRDELMAALPPETLGVSVLVSHEGRERWEEIRVRQIGRGERLDRVAIAAAAALGLLALPGLLLWSSNAAALVPFALLYSVLAVVTVLAIAARESLWASRVGITASVFGPAILSHLALVFPRERQIARDVPAVTWVPYGLAAMLLPAAWLANEHQPLLWPPVSLGLVAFSVAAWAILLLSSLFAVRESASPLERARARTLLSGAIILPLFSLALLFFVSDIATALAMGLMASIALMPLPIGLAISRYNLFDLGNDLRGAVAHILFYSVAACVLAIVFMAGLTVLREVSASRRFASFLLMAVIVLSAIERVRQRILGWMEGRLLPRLEKMRAASRELGREIGALQGPQEVTKHLGEAILNGLSAEHGAVLRAGPYGWTEDFAWGPPLPYKEVLADQAEALLADRTVAQLSEVDDGEPDPRAEALYDAGIRAAAKLGSPEHALAIVLIGAPERASALSTLDLEFVDAVAGQASLALRNAEVAAELMEAEQRAASGRIAVALVHEVGKEVGLLRSLARRLGARLGDRARASRDVRAMDEIAADLDERLRSFVRGAAISAASAAACEPQALGAAVERAARATERIHGEARTIEMLPSAVRGIQVGQQMERVISILLDNAFRASPAEAKVRISGVVDPDELRLTVSDGGTGMSRAERDRAFDPGYTTRREGDGVGIGLPIARELVRGLGGDLTLHQNASGGIDAVVRVPQRNGGGV